MSAGVLPDFMLADLARAGAITADIPVGADQVQPASLDLRLGSFAVRVRASFLPGPDATVEERLASPEIAVHRIDLTHGAVLETGCVYFIPLQERLALPADVSGMANPKSSTGRIDVFVRVVCDRAQAFDRIAPGYHGALWIEVSPRTFPVVVRPGVRLAQVRLRRGEKRVLRTEDVGVGLVGAPAGYRAERHTRALDLDRIGAHDPRDYWAPLQPRDGRLILDPGEFYILASGHPIEIPADEAAEMVPTAEDLGEFRAHYAGFFDPGFGTVAAGGAGSRAVLEVRGRDVPFLLEHGQPIARLVFEPLAAPPAEPYGTRASNYQGQGLRLSKYFGPWAD